MEVRTVTSLECYLDVPTKYIVRGKKDVGYWFWNWKGMIKVLAKFFRGVHLVLGVSAPPEGQNERTFVLRWLGIVAFLIAFGVALTYFLPHLYFRR